jgi:ABC-type thiamine transport system substrate-binding protein
MRLFGFLFIISFLFQCNVLADQHLRIFTWDGYITKKDIKNLDSIFKKHDLNIKAKIIKPYAEGSSQMFNIIRAKKCDVSFLTLFFIKMKKENITKLLEPINVNSKRLSNYKNLLSSSKNLKMGMKNDKYLYIPYGGGVYGFYVDRSKVAKKDIPKSINDLWSPKWKGKISLNKTQVWYNIGISLMALGHPPFYLNNLLQNNQRDTLLKMQMKDSIIQQKVNELYEQAGNFWTSGTEFNDNLSIVSSWGPEIKERNEKYNGKWEKINFSEGNIVWLDTINFMKGISGEKLIAAELLANYFTNDESQKRIVKDLSMIAVSKNIRNNPLINSEPDLFRSDRFVPPYTGPADNIMQQISNRALENLKED